MAPDDPRDKEQRDAQQSSDNPFIRFRQFADAQVGSILQSLIGLPSAFTKSSGNQRWADFDDDLKRRDDLQTRRQQLRDTDTGQSPEKEKQTEVVIPVKKSSDGPQTAQSRSNWPSSKTNMDDEGERDWLEEEEALPNHDVPLYGPVTRSLFTHLKQAAEDNVSWNTRAYDHLGPSETPFDARGDFSPPYDLYSLRRDQWSSNVSKDLQYMVFNNLNNAAKEPVGFRGQFSLHSRSSLLPYLLFSPYSPLRLNQGSLPSHGPDYSAAFEDLILLHNGLPMAATRNKPLEPIDLAQVGMGWLHMLRRADILNEPDRLTRMANTVASADGSSIMKEVLRPLLNPDSYDLQPKEPKTEQDMYDRFLQSASSSPASMGSLFDTLYADAERFIRQEFEGLESTKEKIDRPESSRRDIEKEALSDTPKKIADPERVVSTYTSSEHITHDDGTVETILSIRKRFADGRETVTETTHTRLPRADEESTDVDQGQKSEVKTEGGKRGWFWN